MDELIRPRSIYVRNIVRDILGPHVPEELVEHAALSVGSQWFILLYCGEMIRRLHPHLIGKNNIEDLIDHITEFSLAALRGLKKQRKAHKRGEIGHEKAGDGMTANMD